MFAYAVPTPWPTLNLSKHWLNPNPLFLLSGGGSDTLPVPSGSDVFQRIQRRGVNKLQSFWGADTPPWLSYCNVTSDLYSVTTKPSLINIYLRTSRLRLSDCRGQRSHVGCQAAPPELTPLLPCCQEEHFLLWILRLIPGSCLAGLTALILFCGNFVLGN